MAVTLRERSRRYGQKQAKLEEQLARMKDRARTIRTTELIELGRLVAKAGLATLDEDALSRALGSIEGLSQLDPATLSNTLTAIERIVRKATGPGTPADSPAPDDAPSEPDSRSLHVVSQAG